MSPSQWSSVVLLSTISNLAFAQLIEPTANEGASNCRITPTRDGAISNSELRVGVPGRGRIVFRPSGPGFVTSDGALGMKFMWERLVDGKLQVSGRRIDGNAPPLRAKIPDEYGHHGIQPSSLIFPEPGCWEITARVRDKPLSLVVLVEKLGAGPNGRRD